MLESLYFLGISWDPPPGVKATATTAAAGGMALLAISGCTDRGRRMMRIILFATLLALWEGCKNTSAMDVPIFFQARGAVGDERIGGLNGVTSDLRFVLMKVACGGQSASARLGRRWKRCSAEVASKDEVELLKEVETVFLHFENNTPTRGGRNRNIFIRNGKIFLFGQNIYRSAWDVHNIGEFVGENLNGELDMLRGGRVQWKNIAMTYNPHHVLWFEAKNGDMLQIFAVLEEGTVELEVECLQGTDSGWQECIGGGGFHHGPGDVYSLVIVHHAPPEPPEAVLRDGMVKLRYGRLLFFGVNVWWSVHPLSSTGTESKDDASVWRLRSGKFSESMAIVDILPSEWQLGIYKKPNSPDWVAEPAAEDQAISLNSNDESRTQGWTELMHVNTNTSSNGNSFSKSSEEEECCFTIEAFHPHPSCKKECRQSECSPAWRSWPTMDECCAPGSAFVGGCVPRYKECYVVKAYQEKTCWRDDTKCHQGFDVWPSLEECCESAFGVEGCSMEKQMPFSTCWHPKHWPWKTCVEMAGGLCHNGLRVCAQGWQTKESCCDEGFEGGCDEPPPVPCFLPSYAHDSMRCVSDATVDVCWRGWGVHETKEECCTVHQIHDCV